MVHAPRQLYAVGSGRCGTRTLAELLSSVPGCVVWHERRPPLLYQVSAYVSGAMSHERMVDFLRATRSPEVLGGERLSGEANQRLSFVLGPLAEAFPEARLVWLIRDGRATVASMFHRLWYHPQERELRPPIFRAWAETRIQADEVGDLSSAEWAELDAFARCCWYWSYANRVIGRDLWPGALRVKLEELSTALPAIAELAGSEVPGGEIPRANVATDGPPPDWRSWSPAQRETFARWCGDVMDEHYPGWRDSFSSTAT